MNYDINRLNKISQIKSGKDIKSLSYAMFPGNHCPLFGATMVCCEIEGLQTLVVGTEECTYYTQAFAIDRINVDNNIWSYAMNKNDVVFGSNENIEKAVRLICQETNPKAFIIVTTCVPEITGENFEASAEVLTKELGIPVCVVHTEHFKSKSHIDGINSTLNVLINFMKKQDIKEKTINILGHRFGSIIGSELHNILIKNGYKINLTIPSKGTIQDIENAPSASINLVTDFTGISLAEEMKKKFNIPYVIFDKFTSPDRIEKAYEDIKNCLKIDIDDDIKKYKTEYENVLENVKFKLNKKSFIYGNSPMMAFEISSFLVSIGMKALFIQARDMYEGDDIYIEEILSFELDPYVSTLANISSMQDIYKELKPDFYIGHENPHNLMKYNISQVLLDNVANKLGYELPIEILKSLDNSLNMKQKILHI